MEETDSTEVKYKIRQWSLPGATIVPVLNVSSRVFWLELDDKALLDSYSVLQEGILCDVFSQKCSAAWQGARGERLTVGIMLSGRQDADDWLNFVLSQKNLWPTFTTRATLTEEISEQVFSKERRRLQACICGWWSRNGGGCLLTECTSKPPPGIPKKNWMLCSSTGPPDATAQTHMKGKGIVGLESKKSRHGGRNARIGWHTLKNMVGQQLEWACDWDQISPNKETNNQPNKNNKTSNTHTQAKARARQISQGNLQTEWNQVKHTRPSQPLICSRPPCSTPPRCPFFFFLDFAALVVTTVAVMELCWNSHRLITRSHRLVSEPNQTKQDKPHPPHTNKHKQKKPDQSMKGETGETFRSHYLAHSSIPRLSQLLQQQIGYHTSIHSDQVAPHCQDVHTL